MPENAVIGVILAGGAGTRLGGVTKATLKVGGIRLIDRLIATLRSSVSPILVSIGDTSAVNFESEDDVLLIGDIPFPGSGPVGGLAGAVAYAADELPEPQFLLSVAADTPFFPADFCARALGAVTPDTAAVVAGYEGQAYFTNALWRLSALKSLPADAAEGATEAGLKGLLSRIGNWQLLDYGDASENPFVNINTLPDLLACNRRATAESKPPSATRT